MPDFIFRVIKTVFLTCMNDIFPNEKMWHSAVTTPLYQLYLSGLVTGHGI
jgi:hypothetical protein